MSSATEMIRELEQLACEERMRKLDCSFWRRVGSREILSQPSGTYKGPTGKLKGDLNRECSEGEKGLNCVKLVLD